MPILKRDDGIQFATHAYRETITVKRPSLLRNEVQLLAQNHGENMRLFPLTNNQIEGVFSRDPGYLLGETIWHHFNAPADLIYCEALPEGNQALIVVVRNGRVYIDTKIAYDKIPEEFAPLVTRNNIFEIYVYGDVPVSDTPKEGHFAFDKQFVKSFKRLDESAYQLASVDQDFQLQPLKLALHGDRLLKRSRLPLLATATLVLAIAGWWYIQQPEEKRPAVKAPAERLPFHVYRTALQSPSPEKQLAEFSAITSLVYEIPGWTPSNVTFSGSLYKVHLRSTGGTNQALREWTEREQLGMTLTTKGAELSLNSKIANRSAPTDVADQQKSLSLIVDKMNELLPGNTVSIRQTTRKIDTKETGIGVNFNNISPEIFALIGRELAEQPVTLTSIQANINQGLMSGTIQLKVLGK